MKSCESKIDPDMLLFQNTKWEHHAIQKDPYTLDQDLLSVFDRPFLFYQLLYNFKCYEELRGINNHKIKDELRCLQWIAMLSKFLVVSDNKLF